MEWWLTRGAKVTIIEDLTKGIYRDTPGSGRMSVSEIYSCNRTREMIFQNP